MALSFQCPHCSSSLRVRDANAGRVGTCPKCKKKLRVPELKTQPTAPAQSACNRGNKHGSAGTEDVQPSRSDEADLRWAVDRSPNARERAIQSGVIGKIDMAGVAILTATGDPPFKVPVTGIVQCLCCLTELPFAGKMYSQSLGTVEKVTCPDCRAEIDVGFSDKGEGTYYVWASPSILPANRVCRSQFPVLVNVTPQAGTPTHEDKGNRTTRPVDSCEGNELASFAESLCQPDQRPEMQLSYASLVGTWCTQTEKGIHKYEFDETHLVAVIRTEEGGARYPGVEFSKKYVEGDKLILVHTDEYGGWVETWGHYTGDTVVLISEHKEGASGKEDVQAVNWKFWRDGNATDHLAANDSGDELASFFESLRQAELGNEQRSSTPDRREQLVNAVSEPWSGWTVDVLFVAGNSNDATRGNYEALATAAREGASNVVVFRGVWERDDLDGEENVPVVGLICLNDESFQHAVWFGECSHTFRGQKDNRLVHMSDKSPGELGSPQWWPISVAEYELIRVRH